MLVKERRPTFLSKLPRLYLLLGDAKSVPRWKLSVLATTPALAWLRRRDCKASRYRGWAASPLRKVDQGPAGSGSAAGVAPGWWGPSTVKMEPTLRVGALEALFTRRYRTNRSGDLIGQKPFHVLFLKLFG